MAVTPVPGVVLAPVVVRVRASDDVIEEPVLTVVVPEAVACGIGAPLTRGRVVDVRDPRWRGDLDRLLREVTVCLGVDVHADGLREQFVTFLPVDAVGDLRGGVVLHARIVARRPGRRIGLAVAQHLDLVTVGVLELVHVDLGPVVVFVRPVLARIELQLVPLCLVDTLKFQVVATEELRPVGGQYLIRRELSEVVGGVSIHLDGRKLVVDLGVRITVLVPGRPREIQRTVDTNVDQRVGLTHVQSLQLVTERLGPFCVLGGRGLDGLRLLRHDGVVRRCRLGLLLKGGVRRDGRLLQLAQRNDLLGDLVLLVREILGRSLRVLVEGREGVLERRRLGGGRLHGPPRVVLHLDHGLRPLGRVLGVGVGLLDEVAHLADSRFELGLVFRLVLVVEGLDALLVQGVGLVQVDPSSIEPVNVHLFGRVAGREAVLDVLDLLAVGLLSRIDSLAAVLDLGRQVLDGRPELVRH